MRATVRSPIVTASNVPPACSGQHLPDGADELVLRCEWRGSCRRSSSSVRQRRIDCGVGRAFRSVEAQFRRAFARNIDGNLVAGDRQRPLVEEGQESVDVVRLLPPVNVPASITTKCPSAWATLATLSCSLDPAAKLAVPLTLSMLDAPGVLSSVTARIPPSVTLSEAILADLTTPKVPFWTLTARPVALLSCPVKDDVPPIVSVSAPPPKSTVPLKMRCAARGQTCPRRPQSSACRPPFASPDSRNLLSPPPKLTLPANFPSATSNVSLPVPNLMSPVIDGALEAGGDERSA